MAFAISFNPAVIIAISLAASATNTEINTALATANLN
jgi:hypothetical protein